jgi:hypothetical protein
VFLDDVECFSLYRILVKVDPFPYLDTLHLDFLGTFSEDDVHTMLQSLPPRYDESGIDVPERDYPFIATIDGFVA